MDHGGGNASLKPPPTHTHTLFPRPPASLYPPASGSRFSVTAAAPACRRSRRRRSQVRILLLTHASSASRTGQLNTGPVSPLLMLLTSLFPPRPSVKAPPSQSHRTAGPVHPCAAKRDNVQTGSFLRGGRGDASKHQAAVPRWRLVRAALH